MAVGTIKRVVINRGFGFIEERGAPDVFFHARDLPPDLPFDDTLQERTVRFDIAQSAKGPRACNVRSE